MAAAGDLEETRALASNAAAESPADAAGGWRGYASGFVGAPLAVALTLGAVLAPAVLVAYAYADDYSYLWMAVSGEPNPQFGRTVFEAHTVSGRPILGLVVQALFGAADTIDRLRVLRLVGVIGVIAFALLVQWALTQARVRPWPAALIALLMCSMPGFQVYGSWTVLFAAPYAALLGGMGSVVLARAARRERVSYRPAALGGLLLLGGLFTYQPAAMCFWVLLAIALVEAREDAARAWRLTWLHAAVAAGALLLAYLGLRLALAYYGDSAVEVASQRARLSFDVIGRSRWFVEQPLTESLNLFHLGPSPWLAAGVGVATGAGMVVAAVRHTVRPWLYLGVAVALVPLAYLPNLVIQEEQHPYRTQAALTGLITLYLGLGVLGLWSLATERLRPQLNRGEWRLARGVTWTACIAVVAASCLFAASNVSNLMAGPQMTELRMYRAQVRAISAGAPRVSLVQTGWYQGVTRRTYNDEFGVPSTARAFTLTGSFKLLLREQGRLDADHPGPTVGYFQSDVSALPAGQPAIDLRGMSYLK